MACGITVPHFWYEIPKVGLSAHFFIGFFWLVNIEPLAAALDDSLGEIGYELVDVQWGPAPGGRTLRIFIDREGGVTVGDCERVSRQLEMMLSDDPWGLGSYQLEVSSPGLERPLKKREHFRRFIGRKIAVRTKEAVAGRKNYRGRLEAVEEKTIIVLIDQEQFSIPFDNILKAHLVFEG